MYRLSCSSNFSSVVRGGGCDGPTCRGCGGCGAATWGVAEAPSLLRFKVRFMAVELSNGPAFSGTFSGTHFSDRNYHSRTGGYQFREKVISTRRTGKT